MANIQHKDIPELQLHEPKGASTATSGQVYTSDGAGSGAWQKPFDQLIVVRDASDLAGTLSSTSVYFIDGIIDMGSQTIQVPAGGLNLAGHTFDVSKLTSSAGGYTMFTSPGGGSGNLIGKDYAIEVTGASSQVYNLTSATGFDAFEFARINYNNCTSLGTITDYRQGFETGTGRFGGTPNLTLAGTWVGGYFIEASIVRSLDVGMTGALFQVGAGFSMASRFRSNMNIDLPASAAYLDFAPSHFPNPSTLQLDGMILSRNGAFDAGDSNLTPNISAADLPSAWADNVGLNNTFEGGELKITSEAATTISSTTTFYDLEGTWTAQDLQHFDSPSNFLRHLGNSPREYSIVASLQLECSTGDDLKVRVQKWDDSASSFVEVATQTREVNSFSGGRDIAFFTILTNTTLDQGDYVFLQVKNETSTSNVTAELDSFIRIGKR